MLQLSIFDLPPIQDKPEPVTVHPPIPRANPHTLSWLHAKANYYLKLMNRFMDGKKCSQEVRSAELVRVYEMREEILVTIYQLEDRHQCNEQSPPPGTMSIAPDAPNPQAAQSKTRYGERSMNVQAALLDIVG